MSHRPTQKDTFVRALFAACLTAGMTAASAQALDNAASAKRILRSMSDYMASQKNLSADFDVGLDVVTTADQKIEFTASGTTILSRPDKLRATRRGAYSDIELVFDGETTTIVDRGDNEYAQVKSAGTVDKLIDQLRFKYGVELPAADLLMTNSYQELVKDVVDAKHMGQGVIGGQDCEHLAFRNDDTDWQLWVRTGSQPLPCKLVITTKGVKGSPEYSIMFRNWRMDVPAEGAFAFKPPSGSRAVAPNELKNISDLPASATVKKEAS
jgi:hypothetical protein